MKNIKQDSEGVVNGSPVTLILKENYLYTIDWDNNKNIISLSLNKNWYDLIEKGIKKEDYRDIKQFYMKRLCAERPNIPHKDEDGEVFDCYAKDSLNLCPLCIKVDFGGIKQWWECNKIALEDKLMYDYVLFRCIHTDKIMIFKLLDISIGIGNPEWGAPQDREVFIFKLGNKMSYKFI